VLEGKVVAISGAGPGLGTQIARAALRDGARVFLGARSDERLRALTRELDPSGTRADCARLDLAHAPDCEAFAAAASARFGRIDALVQVAAFDQLFGGVTDSDPDAWRVAFDVNFFGAMQLVKACVPRLSAGGGGAIVFIGAQAMYYPQVMQLGYAASKAALSSAMLFLARELGPSRIRVNTVVPTWIWGRPVQDYIAATAKAQGVPEQQLIDGITAGMAIREIPGEQDIAEAVVFLASDRARLITGQSLLVNSGELFR
jgi:NAD(P)-dependent dehydrogenase (short-subunit alcohol dehydrogenase family)